jgi:hypothetical protein
MKPKIANSTANVLLISSFMGGIIFAAFVLIRGEERKDKKAQVIGEVELAKLIERWVEMKKDEKANEIATEKDFENEGIVNVNFHSIVADELKSSVPCTKESADFDMKTFHSDLNEHGKPLIANEIETKATDNSHTIESTQRDALLPIDESPRDDKFLKKKSSYFFSENEDINSETLVVDVEFSENEDSFVELTSFEIDCSFDSNLIADSLKLNTHCTDDGIYSTAQLIIGEDELEPNTDKVDDDYCIGNARDLIFNCESSNSFYVEESTIRYFYPPPIKTILLNNRSPVQYHKSHVQSFGKLVSRPIEKSFVSTELLPSSPMAIRKFNPPKNISSQISKMIKKFENCDSKSNLLNDITQLEKLLPDTKQQSTAAEALDSLTDWEVDDTCTVVNGKQKKDPKFEN